MDILVSGFLDSFRRASRRNLCFSVLCLKGQMSSNFYRSKRKRNYIYLRTVGVRSHSPNYWLIWLNWYYSIWRKYVYIHCRILWTCTVDVLVCCGKCCTAQLLLGIRYTGDETEPINRIKVNYSFSLFFILLYAVTFYLFQRNCMKHCMFVLSTG